MTRTVPEPNGPVRAPMITPAMACGPAREHVGASQRQQRLFEFVERSAQGLPLGRREMRSRIVSLVSPQFDQPRVRGQCLNRPQDLLARATCQGGVEVGHQSQLQPVDEVIELRDRLAQLGFEQGRRLAACLEGHLVRTDLGHGSPPGRQRGNSNGALWQTARECRGFLIRGARLSIRLTV